MDNFPQISQFECFALVSWNKKVIIATPPRCVGIQVLQGGSAMSMTLNLVDRLLARGKNFQQLGRDRDALEIFDRLAGFRELPSPVAEETQVHRAEILLQRGEYLSARRYLSAVLVQQPDNARYHYLMAIALHCDERGNQHRAARHYQKSLELDPNQPECLSECGLLYLGMGKGVEGLKCLRRAVELSPDDADLVAKLVEGLLEVGRQDEARKTLQAALFRNPRDSRFRKLWSDFQFQQLREEQQEERYADPKAGNGDQGPVLLPFLRPVSEPASPASRARRIRRDSPSLLPPPHVPRRSRLPRHKHA
jgi:tetratricopeptide (TPR) repeat protein